MRGKERGEEKRKDCYWREEKGIEKGGVIEGEKMRGGEEKEGEQRGGKERERRASVSGLLRSVLAADQPWPTAH